MIVYVSTTSNLPC